jgi:hydroxyethylthiazole kinase-like uncharacterized protein yjeF
MHSMITTPQIVSAFDAVAPFPLYRSEEIRRIEALVESGAETAHLMERAGLAAAELARDLMAGSRKPVLVLAGPGNNGGDAFVVARCLKQWWHRVHLVFTGERAKLSADAAAALDAWQASGGETLAELPRALLEDCGLIVDGLFGIGLERPLSGRYAEVVASANASGVSALARRIRSLDRREALLAVYGPLALILLLVLWVGLLIFAFALLQWGLGSQMRTADGAPGFGLDLYFSGTTFLTLGLGDVAPQDIRRAAVFDQREAATKRLRQANPGLAWRSGLRPGADHADGHARGADLSASR